MKQCKCKVCGNTQDYKLLNCQKCGEEMPKVVFKSSTKKEINQKIKNNEKIKYLHSILLSLPFFFFIQLVFEVRGFLFFLIPFIPISILIDNKRAKNIIIIFAISAVISPFLAYWLSINYYRPTDNADPMLSIVGLILIAILLTIINNLYKKYKKN